MNNSFTPFSAKLKSNNSFNGHQITTGIKILINIIFGLILFLLGIYSVFLSQNIFIVSGVRTIALLSSARTVSFVITLLSYFFLTNVIFSLHLNLATTTILLAISSFPLIIQSIWNYTLDKNLKESIINGITLKGSITIWKTLKNRKIVSN